MAGPYDQSHNQRPRNAFEAHLARPFKKAVDILRNRVNDLSFRMASPAFLDQYPARSVPFIYSKLYGPFGLVAPRRNGDVGFIGRAPVVDLGDFITPRNDNIIVNREGPFYWCSTNIAGYMSVTFREAPFPDGAIDGTRTYDIDTRPSSDIFDSWLSANGGAVSMNRFNNTTSLGNAGAAKICFDLDLYDKKRGRKLHEDHLPPQVLTAQRFANKENVSPIRFDPNTEIEPRVRLLEVNPDEFETDQAYDAGVADFKAYLNLIFIGYKVLEV